MKTLLAGLGLGLCWGAGLAWGEPERRLVTFQKQGSSIWAESHPRFDFSCYLPRRYSPSGLGRGLLEASASSGGVPVRLRGEFRGDRVQISAADGEPALVPLDLRSRQPWRGVVSWRDGQFAAVPGIWQAGRLHAEGGAAPGLYRVNAWTLEGQTWLADPVFLGPEPAPPRLDGSLVVLLPEGFLDRSLEVARQGQPQLFSWTDPSGTAGFDLRNAGLTTMDGELRSFGSLSGRLAGLGSLVEGEWEAPLSLRLEDGWLRLGLKPSGQQLRLVKPIFAEMPGAWADAAVDVANQVFGQMSLPLPGAYSQALLDMGLVEKSELSQLQASWGSWGDRRSGAVWLARGGGRAAGPPQELAWLSEGGAAPSGFALGISAEALNRCCRDWLPQRLPYRLDLAAAQVPAPQVLIFKLQLKQLEVQQVDLSYTGGAFQFRNCQVAVHWQLGPLSGVEPGARLSGRMVPEVQPGSPARLAVRFEIDELQFLSPQILACPEAEQAQIRAQIVSAVQARSIPLALPSRVLTPAHPSLPLEVFSLKAQPDRLWLLGRWAGPAR